MWWWLFPHGFPVAHARFFLHSAMPAMVLAAAIGAITALWTGRSHIAAACLIALPAATCGAGVTALVLYPSALRVVAIALLPGILGLAAVALPFFRKREARLALAAGALLGLFDGAIWARAWRAESASTNPAGAVEASADMAPAGLLYLPVGSRVVSVDPTLRFMSCSPDRFLTFDGPPSCPALTNETYAVADSGGATRLLSIATLDEDVYSHLNSFSRSEVTRLTGTPFVSFSPAPDERIEIVSGQYPFGAPFRLAYLGEDGVLRVVQATSGEKGPFHELASGPLRRGQPLTLTIRDGETPIVDITLEDFSAQASTELSPTAGWGLPQNAIEFTRQGDAVTIHVTLASSSVGRGFDSVGHRAGTYRNRVRVRPR